MRFLVREEVFEAVRLRVRERVPVTVELRVRERLRVRLGVETRLPVRLRVTETDAAALAEGGGGNRLPVALDEAVSVTLEDGVPDLLPEPVELAEAMPV